MSPLFVCTGVGYVIASIRVFVNPSPEAIWSAIGCGATFAIIALVDDIRWRKRR